MKMPAKRTRCGAVAVQEHANRSNAQKSTGPRTVEGKAVVAQNAVKHGLLAQEVVIKGEDPGEFELYRDQMLGELAPVGQVESMLAAGVASLKSEVSSEHPRLSEDIGRGRPTHEEPPEGGTPNGADAQEQSRQTNPICVGSSEGQVLCGTEVRNDSARGEVWKTKPICDGIGVGKEPAM